MALFQRMALEGQEQVLFCHHRATGLRAIIAIHSTALGPALGGTRMYPYAGEAAALDDVLRLARGMTYKAAAAGIPHGGGKAVIWGDPATDKSEGLFRAFGRFVAALGGRFITGTDLGTSKEDFVWARAETEHVVALPEAYGGSGDSSVLTAFGVWRGMQAAAHQVWGTPELQGRSVAVQGVGKVGYQLVRLLVEAGARPYVADVLAANIARVQAEFPVVVVPPDQIHAVPCDIFAPCAVGGVLNAATVPQLQCRIVAGSANNQLATPEDGDGLDRRGILYCPDYVINAGGLIQVADEVRGFNRERATAATAAIYDRLGEVFAISREEGTPSHRAADRLAERRIAAARTLAPVGAGG